MLPVLTTVSARSLRPQRSRWSDAVSGFSAPTPALADTEPETLRYRLLHTAARIVSGQRKRKIKIPETWPWARELEACFRTALALVPP